jgi:hypothetical protein
MADTILTVTQITMRRDPIQDNVCGVKVLERQFGAIFVWCRSVLLGASKIIMSSNALCTNNEDLRKIFISFFQVLSVSALLPCTRLHKINSLELTGNR